MEHFRQTYAEVNLAALRGNFDRLLKCPSSRVFFCPMVKANAYGHGVGPVAQTLLEAGVTHLGVALVEEGLEIRKAIGEKVNILVFSLFTEESLRACISSRLTPVINQAQDLKFLQEFNDRVGIHIKFNTGMSRLGFDPAEASMVAKALRGMKQIRLEGLCTHLISGEDLVTANGYSRTQLDRLDVIRSEFAQENILVHALNSSALCALETGTYSSALAFKFGARPGISLYGGERNMPGLEPVMSLHSVIGSTRTLQMGDVVSYGARWTAARDSVIGVVPVGYADGYHRRVQPGAEVLIRGKRVKVVGTICMDYIMVDLTDLSVVQPVQIGEKVTLFGRQGEAVLGADEVAQWAETIAYELLTSVSGRVPRLYRNLEQGVV